MDIDKLPPPRDDLNAQVRAVAHGLPIYSWDQLKRRMEGRFIVLANGKLSDRASTRSIGESHALQRGFCR